MVYQTTLKSLNPPRGTNGEQLQFIGNFPCKVGDTVWTDGNVIFGHRPIRSTPILPVNDEVIPVFRWYLTANYEEAYETGYYDMKGKFHAKELPIGNVFLNDGNNFLIPEFSEELLDLSLTDIELAVDKDGKIEGIRCAFFDTDEEIVYIYKFRLSDSVSGVSVYGDGEIESTCDLKELLSPRAEELYGELADIKEWHHESEDKYQSHLIFLDKNGDWHMIASVNQSFSNTIASGVFTEISFGSSVVMMCYIKNGNIEQEIYTRKGRSSSVSGVISNERVIDVRLNEFAEDYSVDIPTTELIFPLQDGHKVRYSHPRPTVTFDESVYGRRVAKGERLEPLSSGENPDFPFFTNKFDILDKDNNIVVSVDLPAEAADPVNIPIVKLKGDKYLFHIGVLVSETGEFYGGVCTYSKKDGLKKDSPEKIAVGVSGFRLRKMKKSKLGKIAIPTV